MLNYNEKEENRGCGCGCGNFANAANNMNIPNCGCNTMPEITIVNFNNNDCECEEKSRVREEMMQEIRQLEFAIIELAEYLDTHPDCQKALCLHREYAKKVKELKDKYQRIYGPLTINYPCNKWRWLEEPWPWERGNY